MNVEKDVLIERKSIGKTRIVHVDMSKRMRQDSSRNVNASVECLHEEPMLSQEDDEMIALLQRIQEKRDAIYMDNTLNMESFIPTSSQREQLHKESVTLENFEEETIPDFKRRIVVKETNEEAVFDWNAEEYWDVPFNEEGEETLVYHEYYEQPPKHNPYDAKKEVKDYEYNQEDDVTYYQEMQTKVENKRADAAKFIFYTILIVIADIVLIVLLHQKGSLFSPSNGNDLTRYLCIAIKYAVIIHLFMTLFTGFKNRKERSDVK